uniref:Small monomeric GTPase n=1 Tax=Panagrellus redivivus TaxID=6233 RepID=A0A7E4V4G6_PANRE
MQIVVAGSGGVGKSSITIQWLQQRFLTDYDPTIEDKYRKKVFVDGSMEAIEVIDTAGQNNYLTNRERAFRSGDGFLLVFSLTSKESLKEVCDIYKNIVRLRDRDDLPMVLVCNKRDLIEERQVSDEELQKLTEELRLPLLECSAMEHEHARVAFSNIIRFIRNFKAIERAKGEAYDAEVSARNKPQSRRCILQ